VLWRFLVLLTCCAAAEQPIPFSHKQHVALELTCKDCHVAPEPGERMTLPSISKCLGCHRMSKQPIPWKRVYAVAAGVYWSHRTHLDAGITCEDCHGPVARVDVVTKVKDVTSMTGCMDCHRRRGAPLGCAVCHESR
jgi:hypothetical protein